MERENLVFSAMPTWKQLEEWGWAWNIAGGDILYHTWNEPEAEVV